MFQTTNQSSLVGKMPYFFFSGEQWPWENDMSISGKNLFTAKAWVFQVNSETSRFFLKDKMDSVVSFASRSRWFPKFSWDKLGIYQEMTPKNGIVPFCWLAAQLRYPRCPLWQSNWRNPKNWRFIPLLLVTYQAKTRSYTIVRHPIRTIT